MADYKEYHVYNSGYIPGEKSRCLLLLQVDGSGHAGEGFRLSLEGDRLEADIWTSDIFTAPELGGVRLRYEVKVASVELWPNTLSSRWEDVITLLGRGTLVAFRPDAAEDCSAEFRQLYADDGQAMHLEALDVEAEMLEDDDGPGLVPILFARDPPDIREILAKFPDRIRTGK